MLFLIIQTFSLSSNSLLLLWRVLLQFNLLGGLQLLLFTFPLCSSSFWICSNGSMVSATSDSFPDSSPEIEEMTFIFNVLFMVASLYYNYSQHSCHALKFYRNLMEGANQKMTISLKIYLLQFLSNLLQFFTA